MSNGKASRYGPSTPNAMGADSFRNSIFIGGPSKGFMSNTNGTESGTSSPINHKDADLPIMKLPFGRREDNLISLRVQPYEKPENTTMTVFKVPEPVKKTVMNFNLKRTIERLGNIQNIQPKKAEGEQ